MSLTCRTCRRMNPADAQFCYFDGVALDGAGHRGPIAAGGQAFPTPFVFPSGKSCRSFDELVLASDADWEGAKSVLQQGFLESFLGATGRIDLAMTARQAARSPDIDRALDDLLGKFPSTVREPAKLKVVQSDIDLGEMSCGNDLRLKLNLKNVGMGLLHGTVSCPDTPWLAVGDAPPGPQKMFHCRQEMELPVHVVGKALRAGAKPLKGKLLVESNGGVREVMVNVFVPVQRFPEGVLAGAMTPRQVAEKAKAAPKEAAVWFANGAVARWYTSNGWTYPVQGPSATGLGAVQQFFEALGLVAAPKVTISTEHIQFWGAPGTSLEQTVQVHTVEKRPVYAYAVSKAAWLQVGNVILKGQTAQIPLHVTSVPSMPGEELQGQVVVSANGNQRFTVSVTLHIGEGAVRRAAVAAPVGATVPLTSGGRGPMLQVMPPAFPAPPINASPFADLTADVTPVPAFPNAIQPGAPMGFAPYPAIAAPSGRRGDRGSGGAWKHLALLLLLVFGVAAMPVHDYFLKPQQEETKKGTAELVIDPKPYLALRFHDQAIKEGSDPFAEQLKTASMRFGLYMPREPDPKNSKDFKRLTFSQHGVTNNTCIRIDGDEFLFGEQQQGMMRWVKQEEAIPKDGGREIDGRKSVWEVEPKKGERIVISQTAEIVPSEPHQGEQKRRLDTCVVHYEIENKGTKEHRIGIRFLLDTFIGSTDGVPFTIPGRSDLCDTKEDFGTSEKVPDFIQVLENRDLTNPGTVARVQFKIGKQFESPSKVFLGGWPDGSWKDHENIKGARGIFTGWDVPKLSMQEHVFKTGARKKRLVADSAVVLFWDEQPLQPDKSRKVGFSYGLGEVASKESEGQCLLTVGGRLAKDGEFTLAALVKNPGDGETLTLTMKPEPADNSRADGLRVESGGAKQAVPPQPAGQVSTVTWRIRAIKEGNYVLEVTSSRGYKQSEAVRIRDRSPFD